MRTNCSGSISGEATQKASTGARGTPASNSAAIRGTTPQEQKGESAPARAAMTIAAGAERLVTPAIRPSAPAAFSQAASRTDKSRKGSSQRKASTMKPKLATACCGTTSARPANSSKSASQTRSRLRTREKTPEATPVMVAARLVIGASFRFAFDPSRIIE